MTKTPDEIKEGLECCSTPRNEELCRQCPYAPNNGYCVDKMSRDAFYLILQLQAENADQADLIEYLKTEIEEYEQSAGKCCYESRCNAELNQLEALCKRLRDENEQLEAERDAMMQDMNRSCFICKHFNGGVECLNTVCAKCVRWCNWEWRGVQKEPEA